MCFGATCPTCAKKSWRGCGQHIPQALSGVPEEQWCTCTPKVKVNGKEYPPSAKMEVPGLSWLLGKISGSASGPAAGGEKGSSKDDL